MLKRHPIVTAVARLAGRVLAGGVRLLPTRIQVDIRERSRIVRRLDYPDANVVLSVESLLEYGVRLHSCRKEPSTVQWIERWMRGGDVFYDVGANVGAYSLVAAKAHDGKVRVFAFEPSFANYAQLCRNIMLNDCGDSVFALPVALSDRTVLGTFNYRDVQTGGALHAFGDALDSMGQPFRPRYTQQLLSFRLDDLIAQFGLPGPNHLKVDVDGIEPAVFAGTAATLRDPALRTVLVEVFAGSDAEAKIRGALGAAGFALHERTRFHLVDDPARDPYNGLWVRRENGRP